MKIKVKVYPGSSQEKVLRSDDGNFEVWIKDKPLEGRANEELIKIMKKYFGKRVELKSGIRGRNKILEIFD